MEGWISKLKSLDAYPKVNEDFYQRTTSGGFITLASSLLMVCLFFSELRLFLRIETATELSVDTSRGEQLQINFDITFPAMPCSWISLDAMDVSGDMHLDVDHDVYKRRLDSSGKEVPDSVEKHTVGPELNPDLMHNADGSNGTVYCGSCYGASVTEGECCNTCDEVRAAYRRRGWGFTDPQGIVQCAKEGFVEKLMEQQGEGCHLWGQMDVNKVAGNIHFAPGKSFQQGSMHVHDLVPFKNAIFDTSHRIDKLSFGQPYPGIKNPLSGVTIPRRNAKNPEGKSGAYQYFLKVVPTIYSDLRNSTIHSNQYSVTEHFKVSEAPAHHQLPGLFFFYDLSAIKVRYKESRYSFAHFLTSVCAIVGGVFTMSGILDAFIFHGSQAIRKKIDLGKQI